MGWSLAGVRVGEVVVVDARWPRLAEWAFLWGDMVVELGFELA